MSIANQEETDPQVRAKRIRKFGYEMRKKEVRPSPLIGAVVPGYNGYTRSSGGTDYFMLESLHMNMCQAQER